MKNTRNVEFKGEPHDPLFLRKETCKIPNDFSSVLIVNGQRPSADQWMKPEAAVIREMPREGEMERILKGVAGL